MRQEFDQYKDEMADVAESLEMAALDKEMAEEKVSDYEYVHVRLCVCVCVCTHTCICVGITPGFHLFLQNQLQTP